jgi:hypothetical protein
MAILDGAGNIEKNDPENNEQQVRLSRQVSDSQIGKNVEPAALPGDLTPAAAEKRMIETVNHGFVEKSAAKIRLISASNDIFAKGQLAQVLRDFSQA